MESIPVRSWNIRMFARYGAIFGAVYWIFREFIVTSDGRHALRSFGSDMFLSKVG